MIVDATCRSREDRAVLLDGLRDVGVPLLIVRCEVPLELALERATRRLGDPRRVSDATPQIAEEQFRSFEEFDEHSEGTVLRLDTTQPLGRADRRDRPRRRRLVSGRSEVRRDRRAERIAEIRRNVHVGSVEAPDVRARREV